MTAASALQGPGGERCGAEDEPWGEGAPVQGGAAQRRRTPAQGEGEVPEIPGDKCARQQSAAKDYVFLITYKV